MSGVPGFFSGSSRSGKRSTNQFASFLKLPELSAANPCGWIVRRPVSGVLSTFLAEGWVAIHLSDLPRKCPVSRTCGPRAPTFDLAPSGVYRAASVTRCAGGLLHHRFTLTEIASGGLFSVALSRGLPRVGVTHHRALWSPDFPQQPKLEVSITAAARPARPP